MTFSLTLVVVNNLHLSQALQPDDQASKISSGFNVKRGFTILVCLAGILPLGSLDCSSSPTGNDGTLRYLKAKKKHLFQIRNITALDDKTSVRY